MVGNKRWLIIIVLFLANTINYIDRVNISVAGPEISHAFGLGPEAMGVVFSCFFYSYIPLILVMGLLTDRFGARAVMGTGMIIWALGSAATGAAVGLSTLIAARLLLGVGESSSYPAGNRIVREWAPHSERGFMTSIFSCGATAGPAVGFLVTTFLISLFDWRITFFIVAAGTLVWVLVWFWVYRSPERASWLGKEERDYILTKRDPVRQEAVHAMSLAALLRQPVMWGLLLTHGCQVYSIYLFITWLPSYLRTARHLDLFAAGWLATLPYVVTTIGLLVLGFLSDFLLKGADLSTGARRYLMFVCMVLAACVIFVPFAESLWLMEVLVIGSILFATAANTLNYALAGDLIYDKSSAGTVFGLQVTGGNTFGFIAPVLTGFIIAQTHEYTLTFVLAGLLSLCGIAISWIIVRRPLQPITPARPR
jgi:ACS family glucarate transporter-like MFS transporter